MKKSLLLSLFLIFITSNIAFSEYNVESTLPNAIKLYKNGNYSQAYCILEDVVAKDPSNPLAYYYLAMASTQLGKKDEAILNYDKVLTLETKNSNLKRYAKKGKTCIETPDNCHNAMYETIEEEFLFKRGVKFSDKVKNDYEQLKLENMMREMNRNDSIEPQKFKEFKDFSSIPTNDEIVAAIRVLQKAGINNIVGGNDLYMNNTRQDSMLNMLGTSGANQHLIQALLTNNITQGF